MIAIARIHRRGIPIVIAGFFRARLLRMGNGLIDPFRQGEWAISAGKIKSGGIDALFSGRIFGDGIRLRFHRRLHTRLRRGFVLQLLILFSI